MSSYFVYILGNGKGTLYVGMTNDLERRVYEHKSKAVRGFSSKYNLHQLLFFEEFTDVLPGLGCRKENKRMDQEEETGIDSDD